jgi:hypothetical protein
MPGNGITNREQLFRDAEGNPMLSSSGLEISLKDFAVTSLSDGLTDFSINIDSEMLCRLLGEAEHWDNKTTNMTGAEPPPLKRKYRQRTPEDQLTVSDEERFVEEERRVRIKTEKLDKRYGEEGVSAEEST